MKSLCKKVLSLSLIATAFSAWSSDSEPKNESDFSLEMSAWTGTPFSGLTSPLQDQRTITVYKNGQFIENCIMYRTTKTRAIDLSDCPRIYVDNNGQLAYNVR